ncbi:MAG: hypothetical protein ACHP7E_08805 [Burkholderiales bacterium]
MKDLLRQGEQQWSALLRRAAEGDAGAFEDFYRHSVRWSLALARNLVVETEVEGLLTRLYVTAWQELQAGAAPQSATRWLETLALQLAGSTG